MKEKQLGERAAFDLVNAEAESSVALTDAAVLLAAGVHTHHLLAACASRMLVLIYYAYPTRML